MTTGGLPSNYAKTEAEQFSVAASYQEQIGSLNAGKGQGWASPGTLSLINGAVAVAGAYYGGKITQYESERKHYVAQAQYYRKILNQEKANYRQYEVSLNNWYRDADWVEQRRAYEEKRKELQAAYKGEATIAATQNFERNIANVEGRFYEEEAMDIVEMDNIRTQMVSEAVKKVASGQVGRTVQAMSQQYEQQYLANLSNRQITRRFRIQDKENQKVAMDVARENAVNQVRFYEPQPIADPVKPLAPLPVVGVPPTAPAPVSGIAIDVGSKVLGAAMDYMDMQPKDSDRPNYGQVKT
jgi:hypothetical protein